jgi:hypothetical protein
MSSLWIAALRRLRPRILLVAFIGNALLALLAAAWLQIPDSHIWQLILSVVFGSLIVAAFLWLQSSTLTHIRHPEHPSNTWLSCALVAPWIFFFWAWTHLITSLSTRVEDRASYWNSRFNAHQRTFFTQPHLVMWQSDAIAILAWWLIPTLILPLLIETISSGLRHDVLKSALTTITRWQLWVSTAAIAWICIHLTAALITWHPSYTVKGELISATLRLGLACVFNLFLICLIIAVASELLSRTRAGRDVSRDTAA